MRRAIQGVMIAAGVAASVVAVIHLRSWLRVRPLVEFVAALEQARPTDPDSLQRIIGHTLTCRKYANPIAFDCYSDNVAVGDVIIGRISFRFTRSGPILQLERFDIDCPPTWAFNFSLGKGHTGEGCVDAICMERSYYRPWGLISLGLGHDRARTGCVKSVVIVG